MSAFIGVATIGSRPELISVTHLRLRRLGFDGAEAANLTALKNGFEIGSQPWTVRELTHLLFLRELSRVGRRWTEVDDRADRRAVSESVEAPVAAAGTSASAAGSTRRDDADPFDGRVKLLTLFRSMAGPNATLDFHGPSAQPRPDAPGDLGREGG
jgi:hypothetical protein